MYDIIAHSLLPEETTFVFQFLHTCISERLDYSTIDLAVYNKFIDGLSNIVAGPDSHCLHFVGKLVHFDFHTGHTPAPAEICIASEGALIPWISFRMLVFHFCGDIAFIPTALHFFSSPFHKFSYYHCGTGG